VQKLWAVPCAAQRRGERGTPVPLTWDTILGGISIYFLLGFLWARLFITLHHLR
jgi:hypothetical protein